MKKPARIRRGQYSREFQLDLDFLVSKLIGKSSEVFFEELKKATIEQSKLYLDEMLGKGYKILDDGVKFRGIKEAVQDGYYSDGTYFNFSVEAQESEKSFKAREAKYNLDMKRFEKWEADNANAIKVKALKRKELLNKKKVLKAQIDKIEKELKDG